MCLSMRFLNIWASKRNKGWILLISREFTDRIKTQEWQCFRLETLILTCTGCVQRNFLFEITVLNFKRKAQWEFQKKMLRRKDCLTTSCYVSATFAMPSNKKAEHLHKHVYCTLCVCGLKNTFLFELKYVNWRKEKPKCVNTRPFVL